MFTGPSQNKKFRSILKILRALALIITIILAGLELDRIIIAAKTPDVEVQNLCHTALSTSLICWCYNNYGRKCPLEGED